MSLCCEIISSFGIFAVLALRLSCHRLYKMLETVKLFIVINIAVLEAFVGSCWAFSIYMSSGLDYRLLNFIQII